VCTRAIERVDFHLALDVGGERNPGLITATHWEALADACDVRPQFLSKLLGETVIALRENLVPVQRAGLVRGDHAAGSLARPWCGLRKSSHPLTQVKVQSGFQTRV
jgi:serine/threonine-protein kinase HipA